MILRNEFCENLAFFFCKEVEEFPKQVCTKIHYTSSKKLGIIKIITGNGRKTQQGSRLISWGSFHFPIWCPNGKTLKMISGYGVVEDGGFWGWERG